jgi:protein-tyrosine phosphatase
MSHPYDTLRLASGAALIFTPCPGTKNTSVEEAVSTLKAAGANALITLMPADELEKFEASALPRLCADQGITWFHLPVEDDHAPDERFAEAFGKQKASLMSLLEQRDTVAIHCRGGSGRTGFMAAILMLETGHDWDDVVCDVQGLRPGALKMPVHLDYLRETYRLAPSGGI